MVLVDQEEDMTQSAVELISVDGAELEVIVQGTGEPVVFIQTALVAEEFLPLAAEPALRDRYQVLRYHRRATRAAARSRARLDRAGRRRLPSAARRAAG